MTKKAKRRKPAAHQVAVLPTRKRADGTLEVLLMTSRGTGRFVVPKGWTMPGKTPRQAARIEAFEEAGLVGDVAKQALGHYTYWKRLKSNFALVDVAVFRMDVRGQKQDWPESKQRKFGWLPTAEAALLVDEAGLAALILALGSGNATP